MPAISEVKRKLPQDFIDELYENYTPLTVDKILNGMSNKRLTSLRVNTLKYNIQDLMKYFKEINIKFERVPWYADALIIKNADEKEIQKLEIYKNGYIYLQSLSSMLPPLILDPKPNDKVLDLTAAPGSKTTEIAALMKNKGAIVANELDKIRCERLRYNLEAQGASIAVTINGRGESLYQNYTEYFDRVLLDTPCSGEGRFIATNPGTYRDWSVRTVNELNKLQKKLFKSAYNSLKNNGIMVYSTCTINKTENEDILEWALQNFNLKIQDIKLEIKEAIPGVSNTVGDINKSIRILPSQTMEGFFVCKLLKL